MRVLIVGGGIAGSTLAAFLQQTQKHSITLIDQAPRFENIGYAIAVWGNGRSILKKLGIDQHVVEKEGYELPWNVFETTEGTILKTYSMDIFRKFGPTVTISRAVLHESLVSLIRRADIRLGVTVTAITENENGARVTFSDGKTEEYDLVVGADGIGSKVRDIVFGKNYVHHYGWTVWTLWIPAEFAHPLGALEIAGAGKVYFTYPLQDRAVAVFMATNPKRTTESKLADLRETFAEFGGAVQKILKSIDNYDEVYSDQVRYVEMESWTKGRVVIIGDAQHAQSPIIGMGASMALEDAYVLASEISTSDDVSRALSNFEKRRRSRVGKFKRASRRLERWMMADGILSVVRTLGLRFIPNSYFIRPIKQLLENQP